MRLQRDFREFIELLNSENVDFLLSRKGAEPQS